MGVGKMGVDKGEGGEHALTWQRVVLKGHSCISEGVDQMHIQN